MTEKPFELAWWCPTCLEYREVKSNAMAADCGECEAEMSRAPDIRVTLARAESAERRAEEAERKLSMVTDWCNTYGADLVPTGSDSYGEGKRDAKATVKRLIHGAPPPTVEAREPACRHISDGDGHCGKCGQAPGAPPAEVSQRAVGWRARQERAMKLFIIHHCGWGDFFAIVSAESPEDALGLAQSHFPVRLYESDVCELGNTDSPGVLWSFKEETPDSER